MIDLTKFCAEADHYRTELRSPFNTGDHSYATDGSTSIRVPKCADIKAEHKKPGDNLAKLFANACKGSRHYIDMPEYTWPPRDCGVCGGAKTLDTCPECDGEGYVDLENYHNDYLADCKTCDGGGKAKPYACWCCDGTGHHYGTAITHLGNDIYADAYKLDKLKAELPGLKISLDRSPEAPIHFKFKGGDGLLMPCRKPEKEEPNHESARPQ